jgi:hypothetical protein
MAVPAMIPFRTRNWAYTIRPLLGMVAPALMPLCMVVLVLMLIWVTLLDTMSVFVTVALAFCPLGMGMVAMPLMNKVLASMATWVTTTRPLGMGLVVPVLLLLGGAVQALTPILVAVPATIVGPTTRILGIGVVALALLLLGAAILALRPGSNGHADDPRIQYPTYSRGGGDFDVPRPDPCSRQSGR